MEHFSDIIGNVIADPIQSDSDLNMSSSTCLRFNQQTCYKYEFSIFNFNIIGRHSFLFAELILYLII